MWATLSITVLSAAVWATTSPPPRHNFLSLPRIRSERSAVELHYPQLVERFRTDTHAPHGQASPSELAADAVQPVDDESDPRDK